MDRNALIPPMLMPEGSGPEYNALAMPSQVMSSYQPTWRDSIAQYMMGGQRASSERARLVEGLMGSRGLGNSSVGLADLTPAGIPMAAQEGYRAGDDRAMAMALMPGAGRGKVVSIASRQSYAPEQFTNMAERVPMLRQQLAEADAAYRAHEMSLTGPDGLYTAAGMADQRIGPLAQRVDALKRELELAESDPVFRNALAGD